MAFRDTPWPEGTPCWADAMLPDVSRGTKFYGGLLGWHLEDQGEEYGHYQIATLEGRNVAALSPKPPGLDAVPAGWTTYLAVKDTDKTAAKITEAGGAVLVPPMDVGEAGRMALAADPAGAVFGLWQARENPGTQITNVAGTLIWNECMTRDFEGSKQFYTKVFGYRADDMASDEFSYATLNVGGQPIGGIGGIPESAPAEAASHWAVYFGVSDTDSAIAKVRQLGGELVDGPRDTPYGRIAEVADDQGARFDLVSVAA